MNYRKNKNGGGISMSRSRVAPEDGRNISRSRRLNGSIYNKLVKMLLFKLFAFSKEDEQILVRILNKEYSQLTVDDKQIILSGTALMLRERLGLYKEIYEIFDYRSNFYEIDDDLIRRLMKIENYVILMPDTGSITNININTFIVTKREYRLILKLFEYCKRIIFENISPLFRIEKLEMDVINRRRNKRMDRNMANEILRDMKSYLLLDFVNLRQSNAIEQFHRFTGLLAISYIIKIIFYQEGIPF
jgi:hypothetical protein